MWLLHTFNNVCTRKQDKNTKQEIFFCILSFTLVCSRMSLRRYESSHHGNNVVSTPSGVLKSERITKPLRALSSYTSTTSATGHGDIHSHTNTEFSRQFKRKLVRQEACSLLNINGSCVWRAMEVSGGLPQSLFPTGRSSRGSAVRRGNYRPPLSGLSALQLVWLMKTGKSWD